MLDGWYCRSLANEQTTTAQEEGSDDESQIQQDATSNNTVNFKTQYRYLKRKLKFLIYENEFFQDALRSNQRRLLKVSRDRAFLLDRLLQYEKPENTSSESDETESSEDEAKKRKLEQSNNNAANSSTRGRKKKVVAPQTTTDATIGAVPNLVDNKTIHAAPPLNIEEQQQGHIMTPAEVERHLQSRQPVMMELIPERALPSEMFSNEPSLDSESNDHIMDGHVAAEECVAMEYIN